jgi:hypothetical protein
LFQEKSEKFNLYWICNQSGRKLPAGVAFFNESQSDYRLKVDALCDDKLVFLKIASMCDGVIRYRVETVARKGGAPQRVEIGRGHSSPDGAYPIFMELGPFSKTLVMEQSAA